jgi:hypothetical protein
MLQWLNNSMAQPINHSIIQWLNAIIFSDTFLIEGDLKR